MRRHPNIVIPTLLSQSNQPNFTQPDSSAYKRQHPVHTSPCHTSSVSHLSYQLDAHRYEPPRPMILNSAALDRVGPRDRTLGTANEMWVTMGAAAPPPPEVRPTAP